MKRNPKNNINAGSMADIAFLLLIFFLVAMTINEEKGIQRKLAPWQDEPQTTSSMKHQRNVLLVWINANDELMVEGESRALGELRSISKEFIISDPQNPTLPAFELTNIENYGQVQVSKQIISIQNDRETSYETYVKVQNEIVGAYREARNQWALKHFNTSIDDLEAEYAKGNVQAAERLEILKKVYPMRISEAEPVKMAQIEN